MELKLIENNIFEFYDEKLISKNQKKLNGIIINFPFKNVCYKSFDFFWYLPYQKLEDLKIDTLLKILKKKETSNGSFLIEGIEIYNDGPYKLNFIDFNKLKYKILKKEEKHNLELIYLELFL